MALNYQRNSYTLWQCANKTYKDPDTMDIFDTKAVVAMDVHTPVWLWSRGKFKVEIYD